MILNEKTDEMGRLYREYQPRVFRYIYGKLQNREDAEDLTQQVFLKVYKGWDGFDDKMASVSTWIYTIARNTMTDFYRTHRVCTDIEEVPELEEEGKEPLEQVICEETRQALTEALKKLKQEERDLIILHYYSGHTLTHIGEAMELPYGRIKRLHNKALCKLRQSMVQL